MMKNSTYLIAVLSFVAFSGVTSSDEREINFRAEHVCVTMTPIHPDGEGGFLSPQAGPTPFHLLTLQNHVKGGDVIGISLISSMNKTDIRGYYIQARKLEDYNTIVGQFVDYNNHGMTYDCQGLNDTLLHDGTHLKYQPLMFRWIAPTDFEGPVVFWTSVAESYLHYWIGMSSEAVVVTQ